MGKKYKSVKGLYVSDFPDLVKEWDYEKNEKKPEEVKAGSHKKYWWVCSKCSYNWRAIPCSRSKGSDCPACANQVVAENNSQHG